MDSYPLRKMFFGLQLVIAGGFVLLAFAVSVMGVVGGLIMIVGLALSFVGLTSGPIPGEIPQQTGFASAASSQPVQTTVPTPPTVPANQPLQNMMYTGSSPHQPSQNTANLSNGVQSQPLSNTLYAGGTQSQGQLSQNTFYPGAPRSEQPHP